MVLIVGVQSLEESLFPPKIFTIQQDKTGIQMTSRNDGINRELWSCDHALCSVALTCPPWPCEEGIVPILWMERLGLREVKKVAQDSTARNYPFPAKGGAMRSTNKPCGRRWLHLVCVCVCAAPASFQTRNESSASHRTSPSGHMMRLFCILGRAGPRECGPQRKRWPHSKRIPSPGSWEPARPGDLWKR